MKKIAHRIVLSIAILFLIFTIANIVLVRINTNQMLKDVVSDKLASESSIIIELMNEKYPGDWSVREGVLYKGDSKMNENDELVDSIKSLTGSHVTLFLGDLRVATTVKKNEQRATGTKASPEVSSHVLDKGGTYIGTAEVVGESFNTIYIPLKGNDGNIIGMFFIGIPTLFQENLISSFTAKLLIYMSMIMVIAFLGTYFMGQSLAKPVVKLNQLALNIGQLDVRDEIDKDLLGRKDEVGDLARSFDVLSNSLKDFIEKVTLASDQVLVSSTNMSASSQELYASAEDMANTMQDISRNSEEQASDSDKANYSVDELASGIIRVLDSSNSLNSITDSTETLKNNGQDVVEELMKRTEDSREITEKVGTMIVETKESAEQISYAVNVINSISEQTNLLALNASIEAARAGEQGRGFAVVAEEIRKLAEQSSMSTSKVEKIIRELQGRVTNTVEVLDEMRDILEFQGIAAHDTEDIFNKLAANIEIIRTESDNMKIFGSEMDQKKNEIVDMIKTISISARSNAISTQEVAATTEEQTAASSEVADDSELLAQLALSLKDMIQIFKV